MDRKKHWENIYETKQLTDVSWYQPNPSFSLDLINKFVTDKDVNIIDVGGGDSFLADKLIEERFTNLSVLDISQKAIERAKDRLGSRAEKVNWIVSDIVEFSSDRKYSLWYDRAAFHFLRDEQDIEKYKEILLNSTSDDAHVIIGTFSENGPLKCSGIEIKQYSEEDFKNLFGNEFDVLEFINVDHQTPFDTTQNFNFVVMKKR